MVQLPSHELWLVGTNVSTKETLEDRPLASCHVRIQLEHQAVQVILREYTFSSNFLQ